MNWNRRRHKGSANRLVSFFTGSLVGSLLAASLVGAGVMLVLVTGMRKRRRSQVQQQGAKLYDQVQQRVKDAATEVGDKAHQFTGDVQEEAGKLQQRAQEMISEGGQ